MNICSTCTSEQSRITLSKTTTLVMAVITAMTFSACGAAPTPLYQHYQQSLGLTPVMLTIIFASYVLSLLAALLTVGSLSDYVGRRPAIMAALGLNAVAMLLFIEVDSTSILIMARSVQGFATGLATATLGATILDTDQSRGPLLNSITAFGGLTAGTVGAAILVTYGPDPQQLVFFVLLAASVIEALILWHMPETARAKPGVLNSLRPHINVPVQARPALIQVTPVTIASWALGGFYFSLMPSLVRVATGVMSPVVGGLVVGALTFSGAITVLLLRKMSAFRMLATGIPALALGVAITLAGVETSHVALMLAGTIVSGFGFGGALSGSLGTVMPQALGNQRAGLLSAFYVEGYLSFSLPAILTGTLVPITGLPLAAYAYGTAVILLATTSLVFLIRRATSSK